MGFLAGGLHQFQFQFHPQPYVCVSLTFKLIAEGVVQVFFMIKITSLF